MTDPQSWNDILKLVVKQLADYPQLLVVFCLEGYRMWSMAKTQGQNGLKMLLETKNASAAVLIAAFGFAMLKAAPSIILCSTVFIGGGK